MRLSLQHCKIMIFSGLVTRTPKPNPPICAKMHREVEQKKSPTPQAPTPRGKIALLKAEEDMFRHRIKSLPGNRPNMKQNEILVT
ncbi:hypothetical protein KOW79_010206 [Hemibagrus wyckioides]|uniref:Uncharacterized protein n=1 Tax=Hemibagrus wyckioides TaxID=337641 RepID=A0A9D3NTG1_9TELE|nr:hypothetical protein KOW79_010206 [Hemibagrus wyckioides]